MCYYACCVVIIFETKYVYLVRLCGILVQMSQTNHLLDFALAFFRTYITPIFMQTVFLTYSFAINETMTEHLAEFVYEKLSAGCNSKS